MKRLLACAEARSPRRPSNLAARIADLLTLAASMGAASLILVAGDGLIADLERLPLEENLLHDSPSL